MKCPLCDRVLERWFRVVTKCQPPNGSGKPRYADCYHPIWVCTTCNHSVEINGLSKRVVRRKPKGEQRAYNQRPGSASIRAMRDLLPDTHPTKRVLPVDGSRKRQ